jgi:predicted helicase/SOS-response transcriptional repressor LexA
MKIIDILQKVNKLPLSPRDKGTFFEKLIAKYLLTDPEYANKLEKVWRWEEWDECPDRGMDSGIDLVAREIDTGNYWAVQCKFYDQEYNLQKTNIDSFFTASGKRYNINGEYKPFNFRLIVSTTDNWSSEAEKALQNQTIETRRITLENLEDSPVDWDLFDIGNPEDIKLKPKRILRPHQEEAIDAVVNGLHNNDRGKLIMACGTGKTLTALRLCEQYVPKGRILFLAPSIALVSQSLRDWTADAYEPFNAFAVCSDTKVGKDEEDIKVHELAYPATTNAERLAQAISINNDDRMTVIFSTYQSIQVISDAQKQGIGPFDVIICDEAHRTTGATLLNQEDSEFVKVHDNNVISGKKRLYMTATPRIYTETVKKKADEASASLFSMDNEEIYGKQLYELSFGKAVEMSLLSDYKVMITVVNENEMADLVNQYNINENEAVTTELATKIIGSWKALLGRELFSIDYNGMENIYNKPMRMAVAFSKSIKASTEMSHVFKKMVGLHEGTSSEAGFNMDHVDGTMNIMVRQKKLNWLKEGAYINECRILSNAKCLSEGVDVPALDAVIFYDKKESMMDIVQSVGRVMRKAEGKDFGYIILPVSIPNQDVTNYNDYVDTNPRFKEIWKVLKALRSHDESLVDEAEFRRKIRIVFDGGGKNKTRYPDMTDFKFPLLPFENIEKAIYAIVPKKLGDREYWAEWAKDTAAISAKLIIRINEIIKNNDKAKEAFDKFIHGLQRDLNPSISQEDAVEMLSQHIITRPVFDALFEGYLFSGSNPVAKAMQEIADIIEEYSVSKETEGLERFYENVRKNSISYVKSDKSRQDVIRNLYDTFFKTAFPKMSERLGIVYTPVEVVDFIIHSVEYALQNHFKTGLSDKNVQILDPFTGTGTFITRLLQSGLIETKNLPYKYENEIHANEIVLLAYYVATVNIENIYHSLTGKYKPFEGMVLADTFQMFEDNNKFNAFSETNSERAKKQKEQDIKVIMGNPPYSAGQTSANDNNQNIKYPKLDDRISETYGKESSATNKNSLYDSYIRAIRWASDRIKDKGVIGFVTNGSFIDGNAADGIRKTLVKEFSHLYIFNLRGNARTQGEERRKEGGGIFAEGSRTPVAITIMIKDPSNKGECELFYYDIGDYLNRDEKLNIVAEFKSIENLPYQRLAPNDAGDWINQRDELFDEFMALGDKKNKNQAVIFSVYSRGVGTNRDAWVYNYSKHFLKNNIRQMIETYNENVKRYNSRVNKDCNIEDIIDSDPKKISWSEKLKQDLKRGKFHNVDDGVIIESSYRPFSKEFLYLNRYLISDGFKMYDIFPSPSHDNIVIAVTGVGASKQFSALALNYIPNLHTLDTGQCFPRYYYEKVEHHEEIGLFENNQNKQGGHGIELYERRDAITDEALNLFKEHYNDDTINKDNLFHYIYGILHSPEYKKRFGATLKRMLPRIPFAQDFWAFSNAGRELMDLHINYEEIEPFSVVEDINEKGNPDYTVNKMRFGKKDGSVDKSIIVYNSYITFKGIPLEAYDYIVNGKPAVEWVMERYQISTDKDSGILNDPNEWSDHPKYIIDLLKKVINVSVKTIEIVNNLPGIFEPIKQDITPIYLKIVSNSDIAEAEKFVSYLPVYSLEAAASAFGKEEYVENSGWMKAAVAGKKLNKDMFIAKVVGKSMEPIIPDGSYCIFRFDRGGSRDGAIVLVESKQVADRETNQKYTVKKYHSEKEYLPDGTWRHKRIILSPVNKEFEPIILENVSETDFRVVAEFIGVI